MNRFEFDAIGCRWEIETSISLSAGVRSKIFDRIGAFDAAFSRFRSDSLVGRMAVAERGGEFRFPAEAAGLFELYDRLHAITGGAVDPMVGRDLELMGYDADYSLAPDLAAIGSYQLERRVWRWDVEREDAILSTRRPVVLDVGAAGKGLLADIVSDLLLADRIDNFVVDASGDLVHRGNVPLEIGLEHPSDPSLAIGLARLANVALCASGTTRRSWRSLHHIVDGRTGKPTREIASTWAVAENAMTADGLATALFFVPADRLAHDFDFQALRVFTDGRAEITAAFPGELFDQ